MVSDGRYSAFDHAVQGMSSRVDDRLRDELGSDYDRHSAGSAGTDKLSVDFALRAPTPADAIWAAGTAAAIVAELLTDHAATVDLSGVALVIRAA
jgi:hypothetical protein